VPPQEVNLTWNQIDRRIVKPNMAKRMLSRFKAIQNGEILPIATKASDELVAPLAPFFCTNAKLMALNYQSLMCATYASRPKCNFEKKY
jgi:hypothetical protein